MVRLPPRVYDLAAMRASPFALGFACVVVLHLAVGLAAQTPPASGGGVLVDRARGEVRIPAWFVNATRKLEVLACHESGPTHEAALAFKATGNEIFDALKAVGLRGPEFWNASGPGDLQRSGGDRVVVWVEWEWMGKRTRQLAEEILREESTLLPLYVRGFSFAAAPMPLGDPPRPAIPEAVEITIGGLSRQSASFSMLAHPNDLPQLLRWAPAPEVSPAAVPHLASMVEAQSPCWLVVSRSAREGEFIERMLEREGDPLRRAVREAQRPLAAGIDVAKRELEPQLLEASGLLEDGQTATATDDEKKAIADRLEEKLQSVAAGNARIRSLYLRLWGLEEEERARRISGLSALDVELRERFALAYASGFRFEVAMAALETEAERLAVARAPETARTAVARRSEALNLERERRWARFALVAEVRPKLKGLDPKEDPYLRELFLEDEERTLADLRYLRARVELLTAEADELSAAASPLSGPPAARERELRNQWKARAGALQELAALEQKRVKLREDLRWARNPIGATPADEAAKAAKTLEISLREHDGKLEKALAAFPAAWGPLPPHDEPPRDANGAPLFPEGAP